MNKIQLATIHCVAISMLALLPGCGGGGKESLLESGENYFSEGKYEEAKIQYLKVLKEEPGNVTAIARIGQMWFEQGAPMQAVPFLLACKKNAPENLENRVYLSEVLLTLGARSEARTEVLEILAAEPDNERALILLADTSTTPEELQETRDHLQAVKDPDQPAVWIASAMVALREKDLESAEQLVDKALARDPKSYLALNTKAILQFAREEATQAEATLKAAAEFAPPRSPIKVKYARMLLGTGKHDEADQYLDQLTTETRDFLPAWRLRAEMALAKNDLKLAQEHLNNVFGPNLEDLDGQLLQVQIWLAEGDAEKALENVKSLRDSYSNIPAVEFHLARAYLLAGNPSQADAALDRAITLNPNYNEAIMLRARLNLRQGKVDDVIEAMVEFLKRYPTDFQAQLLLADAYRAAGRLNDAARVLATQLEQGGDDFRPRLFLGIVLRQQNKIAEARPLFEQAQELAPDNLLITSQLAALDLAEKDFASAAARVGEQLTRNPESPGAHFLHARVLAEQSDWDGAEGALREAIRLQPDFLAAYDLLTRVLVESDKLESAATQLENYLTDNPDTLSALMQLASVYDAMKQYDKATSAYERLLKIDRNFAPALNNLAWLYSEHHNDLKRAMDLAQQARELPLSPSASGSVADTLGWIHHKQGNWRQALTLLQEAVGQIPDQPEVQYHLGMAASMMGQEDLARDALQKALASEADFAGKEEARHRLAQLDEGALPGKVDIAALLKRVESDPNDLAARMALASAYEQEGRHQEAVDAYLQVLEINPELLAALTPTAALYAGPLDQQEKALTYAKRARDLAPGDSQVAGILGSVAFQAGNYSWAQSLLTEATQGEGSKDPKVLHDLAWATYSMGQVDKAREAMVRAREASSDPQLAAPCEEFLALTDPSLDNLEKLAPKVQAILARDQSHVPALMAQAALEDKQGDSAAAVSRYTRALEIYPDFAPAMKGLALIYARDPAKWDEAERLALKAREALPDDLELASALASLNFRKGKYSYVAGLLKEVASKRALSANEMFQLGMSQAEVGTANEARQTIQSALDAGLSAPDAEKAREWLNRNKEEGS